MVKPTHDEIIRQLTRDVAVLEERVQYLSKKVDDLKKEFEEASKRRWSLLPPVVGAIVSALLAALVAFFVAHR